MTGNRVGGVSAINEGGELRCDGGGVSGSNGIQPGRTVYQARRDEIVGSAQRAGARKASVIQSGHLGGLYRLSAAPVQQQAQILDRLGGALVNSLLAQNAGKQLGGARGRVAFGHCTAHFRPEIIHEIGR